MKITLETTDKEIAENGIIVIESSGDCGNAENFFDTIRRAALAWGFGEKTVEEFIPYE